MFVIFCAGEHGNFTFFLASFQGGNPFTSLLRNLACLFSYIFSGLSKNVNNGFLVIKKNDDIVINNAVGLDFLKYNIIEFENPNDELNIDVLQRFE